MGFEEERTQKLDELSELDPIVYSVMIRELAYMRIAHPPIP